MEKMSFVDIITTYDLTIRDLLDYPDVYNIETITLVYAEVKRRNLEIPTKKLNILNLYAKKNGFSDIDASLKTFLEKNNYISYQDYYTKNKKAMDMNLAINNLYRRKSGKMNFSIAVLIGVFILGAVGYVGYMFQGATTAAPIVLVLIAAVYLLVGGYLGYIRAWITIATSPICGIYYIISKGGSTHSLVAMSSMIVPLLIGSLICSQTIARPITSLGAENNNKVKQLLTTTYQSWKDGLLDRFSNQFKQIAEKKNSREFIEAYYPFWNLFSWPLSKYKFNDSEFLIFLSKAVEKKSYILTNQKLFCFTIGDDPAVYIISLSEIKSYEFTADTMKLNFINEAVTINNVLRIELIQDYLDYLSKNELQ
jgi:hypothetical protein